MEDKKIDQSQESGVNKKPPSNSEEEQVKPNPNIKAPPARLVSAGYKPTKDQIIALKEEKEKKKGNKD